MIQKNRTRLTLDRLEARDVPAQFGVPWDHNSVTLSFVPDGTMVDGVPSVLFQSMASQGMTTAAWQTAILRSAQTWLQPVNVNVGVVADGGLAIGAAGAPQGDSRFGDIRVSARPLSDDVIAISVPPGPASGTRAGDIIINSSKAFTNGGGASSYDLYSAMLQEVGHALGVGNSSDTASPMYPQYLGVRAGLTPNDTAAITSLYGARKTDAFDSVVQNGSMLTATPLAIPSTLSALSGSVVAVDSDLTSATDADFFTFTIPVNSASDVNIRLRVTGQSLLNGRLAVYNSLFALSARGTAFTTATSDAAVALKSVVAGQTYIVRVDKQVNNDGTATPFSVGRYRLEINFNPTSPLLVEASALATLMDGGTNDTIANAQALVADSLGRFLHNGRFESLLDTDVFSLVIPGSANLPMGSLGAAEPTYALMTVSLRAASPAGGLRPVIAILDSNQTLVPWRVVRNADGDLAMQAKVVVGATYFIASSLEAGSTQLVDYRLDVRTNISATALSQFAVETLGDANPKAYRTLFVYRGSVMHFVINGSLGASADFGVKLEVFDEAGNRVAEAFARANRSASVSRYLGAGEYTMRLTALARVPGQPIPDFEVTLGGFNLSDPIGPGGDNPDGGGGGGGDGGDYGAEEQDPPGGDDYPDPDPPPEW